jgi:hypothetical protein
MVVTVTLLMMIITQVRRHPLTLFPPMPIGG